MYTEKKMVLRTKVQHGQTIRFQDHFNGMLYVTIQSLQQQNMFSDIQIRKYILLRTKLPCPAGTIVVNTNKPAFCICEKKGADQLRGNRAAN